MDTFSGIWDKVVCDMVYYLRNSFCWSCVVSIAMHCLDKNVYIALKYYIPLRVFQEGRVH